MRSREMSSEHAADVSAPLRSEMSAQVREPAPARVPSGPGHPVLRFRPVTNTARDEWLGVPALAKQLGVTITTLYRILDSGELPAYKIGRVIRIQRVDVEAFRERTKGKRSERPQICHPVEHPRANAEALAWRGSGDTGLREAAGDDWIMAPEAARLLGVQLRTVHHMIGRGELAAEVTYPTARPRTRRRIRIRRQEVSECIERSRVKPGALRHLHPQPSDRDG